MPILRELEKKFPFTASMSDVPDETWDIMPLCSSHRLFALMAFLPSKNLI